MIQDYFSYEGVELREAHVDDISFLVTFLNDAYSYQDHIKGEPRTNPEHLAGRMNEVTLYIAENSGTVAGCFYLEPKGKSLHFGLLTVTDEFKGKGLAPAMIEAIEKHAKQIGFRTLELDYMSVAPWLKNYYEKHGFTETGEIKHWGKIDLVHMSKALS